MKEYHEFMELYKLDFENKLKYNKLPWYLIPKKAIEDNCLVIIIALLIVILYYVKGNKEKDFQLNRLGKELNNKKQTTPAN